MRFMMLYRPYNPDAEAGIPPKPKNFARMDTFIADQAKAGALLATEGLKPSSQGARIRLHLAKGAPWWMDLSQRRRK